MLNPNQLRSEIVARRTYQRPLAGGKFESWKDVCARVVWDHQKWLWERSLGRNLNQGERSELKELEQLMLERKALVAGRTLWLGGTPTSKRREISNFNCCNLISKTINDFVDHFWLLLNGSGVGFKPVMGSLSGFKSPIKTIQVIRSTKNKDERGVEENSETIIDGVWTIRVGDSGEAWAKSLGKLLSGKHSVHTLVFDFSEVRGAGGRLEGYGWISSGDQVIAEVYPKIASLLSKKAGQLLDEIDMLDIGNYLGVIQTGRRGAEICLMDFGNQNWKRFATAKKDFWLHDNHHRTQSNNTLMFWEKPSSWELSEVLQLMVESGGSEPGLLNAKEARRRAPWFEGVNPCVTGNTPILTNKGYVPIKATVGKETEIWNGTQWSKVTPFSTGMNQTYLVSLSDGSQLECTGYHKWILQDESRVATLDLKEGDKLAKFAMPVITAGDEYPIDAYSQGFYSGDGTTGYNHSNLYSTKWMCKDRLIGRFGEPTESGQDRCSWIHGAMMAKGFVPISGSLDYCLNWLAGILDSDGTVTRDVNGNGFQICAIDLQFLRNIQLMLTRMGVRAKISWGNEAGMRMMPDGKGGSKEYMCQQSYRLLIGNTDTYNLLNLGLKLERLETHSNPPQRDARRFVSVVSVMPIGYEETFCFTDPIANRGTFNGIVTGNCGEILLGDKSQCNLVEVDLNAFSSWSALERAVYVIARANYRQTQVNLNDGILQPQWHQNNEFLRLCGVSLTGWALRSDITDHDLKRLKNHAIYGAYSMAYELGSEIPKNITTVKPSGSVSKVMGTTEGIHKPLGKYIFNNVTFSRHEPIVEILKKAGYRVFDNPSQPDGVVVTLPISWDKVETFNDSAFVQLENYKRSMNCWTEQNTSITVSYDDNELEDIHDWMLENWDSYVGVSFIKRTDASKSAEDLGYLYLPQEVVSEEKYKAYLTTLQEVDLSDLKDTGGVEDLDFLDDSCESGICPIR